YKFNISPCADEIGGLLKKVLAKIKNKGENSSELEFKVELSLREMLANAIEHGCKKRSDDDLTEDLEIIIMLKIYADKISIQVQDPGSGFNWKDHNFKMGSNFEAKGRGLKMINKVADKIEFNQQGNIITVFFNL
ncbi:MAG: ATP-binding protein, partial [Halanaerobium sp.]